MYGFGFRGKLNINATGWYAPVLRTIPTWCHSCGKGLIFNRKIVYKQAVDMLDYQRISHVLTFMTTLMANDVLFTMRLNMGH
jgi:hypothetical protein